MKKILLLIICVAVSACAKEKKESTPSQNSPKIDASKTVPHHYWIKTATCDDGREFTFNILQFDLSHPAYTRQMNAKLTEPLASTFIDITMPIDSPPEAILSSFESQILPRYCTDREPMLKGISEGHLWSNGVLISYSQHEHYVGVYPTMQSRYFVHDVTLGRTVPLSFMMSEDGVNAFAKACNKELQKELATLKEKLSPTEYTAILKGKEKYEITPQNLDEISYAIGKSGGNILVTLKYDFKFPHTMQSLEPKLNLQFNREQLQEYLNEDGLLKIFDYKG